MAEQQSVRLTPPDLASVPAELRRADGTSMFRPRHTTVFTSADLLAAEDRLLTLSRTTSGPALPALTVGQATASAGLGADQVAAVTAGRVRVHEAHEEMSSTAVNTTDTDMSAIQSIPQQIIAAWRSTTSYQNGPAAG